MSKLKYYRLLNNFTMKQISDLLGISETKYKMIENNDQTASSSVAEEIAKLFKIEVSDLFEPNRISYSAKTIEEVK